MAGVDFRRAVVMVPTYCEAGNLETLARRVAGACPGISVLCVDDGSPDGTGDIGDRLASELPGFSIVHRQGPRGYAAASREGLARCVAGGYRFVVTMDADLSHDPSDIPRLLDAVDAGAGLAIGSRYVEGGSLLVDWGPVRRAVSRMGSGYARTLLGVGTRDCTSGFRCYSRDALAAVPLREMRSEGYSFLIEVLASVSDSGAGVVELPITYVDRQLGESKISRPIIAEALVQTTLLGIRRAVRR